jgi:hypothetical protein
MCEIDTRCVSPAQVPQRKPNQQNNHLLTLDNVAHPPSWRPSPSIIRDRVYPTLYHVLKANPHLPSSRAISCQCPRRQWLPCPRVSGIGVGMRSQQGPEQSSAAQDIGGRGDNNNDRGNNRGQARAVLDLVTTIANKVQQRRRMVAVVVVATRRRGGGGGGRKGGRGVKGGGGGPANHRRRVPSGLNLSKDNGKDYDYYNDNDDGFPRREPTLATFRQGWQGQQRRWGGGHPQQWDPSRGHQR